MPNSRIEFRNYLKEKTGVKNLYFQPPESIKMKYPAIIYSIDKVDNRFAGNKNYLQLISYQVILIDNSSDDTWFWDTFNFKSDIIPSDIFKKLSKLPMCRFERAYTANNLNHFVFSIYY